MKTAKLISLLFMSLVAAKSFAYTSHAHVCNKTSDTFQFKLVYKYQADVNTPDSYQFTLPPGQCHTIGFYMLDTGNYVNVNDDDLMFQDQINPKNTFHIKNDYYCNGSDETYATIELYYFNMPGYIRTDYQDGKMNNPNDSDMYFTISPDSSRINGAGILPWASSNSSLQKLKPFSNNGLNK